MSRVLRSPTPDRHRFQVRSAAAIFAGAAALNLIEALIPGGPSLSLAPGFCALTVAVLLFFFGESIPGRFLVAMGPIGVALVGLALATTHGFSGGAILYVLPVIWQTGFYGRRGAFSIVACVAVAQAAAVAIQAPDTGFPDRWLDVVATVAAVAAVVEALRARNDALVARLADEATVDDLTGLLNRRGFGDRVAIEVERSKRNGSVLNVLSFDLDHFKAVNDEFGHETGDRVLQRMAGVLRGELRTIDVIARMGGEEFLAVLPDAAVSQAEEAADRVRNSLREGAHGPPRVTVSAGLARAAGVEDLAPLMRAADRALYRAKSAGRDRTVVGPPIIDTTEVAAEPGGVLEPLRLNGDDLDLGPGSAGNPMPGGAGAGPPVGVAASAAALDPPPVVTLPDRAADRAAQTETRAEQLLLAERIIGFGVWRWELPTQKFSCSDNLYEIFGAEPPLDGDPPTSLFTDLIVDADRDYLLNSMGAAFETKSSFAFEYRIRRGVEERVLFTHGEVIDGPGATTDIVFGVTHDVTDRASAESARGAGERRLRAIVDSIPSMVVVKDALGRYVLANRVADEAAGVAAGELIGMGTAEAFPRMAERQAQRDDEVRRTGRPVYAEDRLEIDGDLRTYRSVTFALRGADGETTEICSVSTDLTERAEREVEINRREQSVRLITAALDEDRLVAYAQPIVDPHSGEVVSRELLVRIRERDGSLVLPGEFLPAAELSGAIQPIDLWMARVALRAAADCDVHVNISPVTMEDPVAGAELLRLLSADPQLARRLTFEITETADPLRLQAANQFALAVREIGCRLALDDFGVGFGSFSYLRTLPVGTIKIDRSFIARIVTSPEDRLAVEGVLGMAGALGVQTIAEGVEDPATLALLADLGVDYVQGFHLGRPSPLELRP